jgi:hypothetical protein
MRLAMEISAIQTLAVRLTLILQSHDPLSEPVHLSKAAMLMTGVRAALRELVRRPFRTASQLDRSQAHEY